MSAERSSLKRIVRKAMDTEACEEIVQAGAPDYSVKPPGAQVGGGLRARSTDFYHGSPWRGVTDPAGSTESRMESRPTQ